MPFSSRNRILGMEIDGKSSRRSSRTSPMFIRARSWAAARAVEESGDSVAIRVSARLVAGEEDEPVLPDLDLVAVGQLDGVDAVPVDVGAVEGSDVGDREGVAGPVELRVLPRDGHVVEEDLAVGVPAGVHDVLV